MVTVSSVAATEQHDNTITVTATKRIQSSFDVIGNVNVQTDEQLKKSLVNQTDDLSAVFPELLSANRSSRIYNNMTLRGQSSADFFLQVWDCLLMVLPAFNRMLNLFKGLSKLSYLKAHKELFMGVAHWEGLSVLLPKNPVVTLKHG